MMEDQTCSAQELGIRERIILSLMIIVPLGITIILTSMVRINTELNWLWCILLSVLILAILWYTEIWALFSIVEHTK